MKTLLPTLLIGLFAATAWAAAPDEQTSPATSATFKIVYDNYSFDESLKTDWGFGCVITGPKSILFDTGREGDLLLANLKKMSVRPEDIDVIVISHNHNDHTGGLIPFLKENPNVSVYLPPQTPESLSQEVKRLASEATVVTKPTEVCEGALVLGPIGDRIVEQALVVVTSKGLVIVTGCSHPGIVDIAKKAKEDLKQRIYMVLGGTHLLRHSDTELQAVVDDLKKLGVRKIAATHCSGEEAISLFRDAFGDDFVKTGVGHVIEIDAK